MEPTNRRQFRDYILRRLGAPVQEINVDLVQVEDRIDDALSFFAEYHYLGSERIFYRHRVTSEDIRNGYITVPDNVMDVNNVLSSGALGGTQGGWATPGYAAAYNSLMALSGPSIVPYYLAMTRISDLDHLLGSQPSIDFNRHRNRIQLFGSFGTNIAIGSTVVLEGTGIVDPKEFSDLWRDRILKNYATALVKRQWGENIKLFSGTPLLGNVTLDGKTVYDEAVEEIRTLEEKMINSFSSPVLDRMA